MNGKKVKAVKLKISVTTEPNPIKQKYRVIGKVILDPYNFPFVRRPGCPYTNVLFTNMEYGVRDKVEW